MDSEPIILKPSDKPKKRHKELITEKEAEKAGEAVGMIAGKIKGLRNKAVMGRYIEQLGATQIGRGTLLVAQNNVESDIEKIQGFISQQDGGELCLIMDLYKLKAVYEDLRLRVAQAQMKMKGETTIINTPAAIMPAFPPGTVIAQQVAKIPDEPKPEETSQ